MHGRLTIGKHVKYDVGVEQDAHQPYLILAMVLNPLFDGGVVGWGGFAAGDAEGIVERTARDGLPVFLRMSRRIR